MGFLDRAKEAAGLAKSQARVAREQGQHRFGDLQARRQAEALLREVGLAAYDEHRGEASHEGVVRALAKLDDHLQQHPVDLSSGALRGYLRTATGAEETATDPTEESTERADPAEGEPVAKPDPDSPTAEASGTDESSTASEERSDPPKK
ncbi:MAG: hypothetical protein ACRDMV_16550 [Streptosporangiales bacterium]